VKRANHTTLFLGKLSHSVYTPHEGVVREPHVGKDTVEHEGELPSEWSTIIKGMDTTDFSPNLKEDPWPHFFPHL